MSVARLIATRYLRSHRNNRFLSWMSTLSIAGIAIGIAAMIVVLSVINGFETELRNRFLAAQAHILAYRFPSGLVQHERWQEVVKKDFGSHLTGVSPFIQYETMAIQSSFMNTVQVRGIHPRQRERVQALRKLVRPQSALQVLQDEIDRAARGEKLSGPPGIIIGSGLVSMLGVGVSDKLVQPSSATPDLNTSLDRPKPTTVQLVSPQASGKTELKTFRVVGIYDSGLKHYDNKLGIMSIKAAQDFFKMGDRVTGLEIGVKRPQTSRKLAAEMRNTYILSIKDWQEFNASLFEAMQVERAIIAIIVFLIALVASFNILTTLFVSVSQKQKDISLLKALGATNGQILSLFLRQGAYIGAVGACTGTLLAVAISLLLREYEFIDLPDLYLLARLPIEFDWQVYLGTAVTGLILSILAGLYPAWAASKVLPSEGFKGNITAFR